VPENSAPLQQNRTNNDTSGAAKVLSHYLVALTSADAAARVTAGNSPYALASLITPATLQLQHVRLQV
jgi:hypothetical protein